MSSQCKVCCNSLAGNLGDSIINTSFEGTDSFKKEVPLHGLVGTLPRAGFASGSYRSWEDHSEVGSPKEVYNCLDQILVPSALAIPSPGPKPF